MGEYLEISESCGADCVSCVGAEIKGENIVSKALRFARGTGAEIPSLKAEVHKTIPPGMGMGGGSGNAGAILDFVGRKYGALNFTPIDAARKIGADVPFFICGADAAVVSGIGESVENISRPPLRAEVHLPKKNSPTTGAYKALDEYWANGYPSDFFRAREEILQINSRLIAKERVGLLPNDFAPFLMQQNAEYAEFFRAADDLGAIAWGITGSGAGMFALFDI